MSEVFHSFVMFKQPAIRFLWCSLGSTRGQWQDRFQGGGLKLTTHLQFLRLKADLKVFNIPFLLAEDFIFGHLYILMVCK